MTLLLLFLSLFTSLPDLVVGTRPTGLQLNGNVKGVVEDRPHVEPRGSGPSPARAP